MAVKLTKDGPVYSPASKLLDEAIELVLQERSPYPDRAWFLDYDAPQLGDSIAKPSTTTLLSSSSGPTAAPVCFSLSRASGFPRRMPAPP